MISVGVVTLGVGGCVVEILGVVLVVVVDSVIVCGVVSGIGVSFGVVSGNSVVSSVVLGIGMVSGLTEVVVIFGVVLNGVVVWGGVVDAVVDPVVVLIVDGIVDMVVALAIEVALVVVASRIVDVEESLLVVGNVEDSPNGLELCSVGFMVSVDVVVAVLTVIAINSLPDWSSVKYRWLQLLFNAKTTQLVLRCFLLENLNYSMIDKNNQYYR